MVKASGKITIQDVARHAKVSVTSVSNYLNARHTEMRQETLERIAETIQMLGYTPNSAAQQLKTGRAPMLGLLVPSVINPYYAALAVAIDAAAQQRGLRLILCNTQRQAEREIALVTELAAQGVHGILAASVLQNTQAMQRLIDRGLAFVLFEIVDAAHNLNPVDVVAMNNEQATKLAVNYLVAQGHRSLAYITATPLTPHRRARLLGFQTSLSAHKLATDLIITDDMLLSSTALRTNLRNDANLAQLGRLAAQRIMAMPVKERPSAIVALNDQIALGAMFAFLEYGLRVPQDMSIVGIDDIPLSGMSYPALTTIRQPYVAIADTAVACVCTRLECAATKVQRIDFAPELIIRASSTSFISNGS